MADRIELTASSWGGMSRRSECVSDVVDDIVELVMEVTLTVVAVGSVVVVLVVTGSAVGQLRSTVLFLVSEPVDTDGGRGGEWGGGGGAHGAG